MENWGKTKWKLRKTSLWKIFYFSFTKTMLILWGFRLFIDSRFWNTRIYHWNGFQDCWRFSRTPAFNLVARGFWWNFETLSYDLHNTLRVEEKKFIYKRLEFILFPWFIKFVHKTNNFHLISCDVKKFFIAKESFENYA